LVGTKEAAGTSELSSGAFISLEGEVNAGGRSTLSKDTGGVSSRNQVITDECVEGQD